MITQMMMMFIFMTKKVDEGHRDGDGPFYLRLMSRWRKKLLEDFQKIQYLKESDDTHLFVLMTMMWRMMSGPFVKVASTKGLKLERNLMIMIHSFNQ